MILNLIQGGMANFDLSAFLIELLLSLPVFLLALSFHEAAHAYVAYRCGDPTAKMLGRMTLNPVKHIDPFGFAMLFLVGLGWAKPVPVNPRNYKNYRKDDLLVSIAGICANLILFVVSVLLMYVIVLIALNRMGPVPQEFASQCVRYAFSIGDMVITPTLGRTVGYIYQMLTSLAVINLVLACFNLLPVPPLDGYHVFNDLLFKRRLFAPEMAMRVGQGLLFLLLFTGLLDRGLNFAISHAVSGVGSVMVGVFTLFKFI